MEIGAHYKDITFDGEIGQFFFCKTLFSVKKINVDFSLIIIRKIGNDKWMLDIFRKFCLDEF